MRLSLCLQTWEVGRAFASAHFLFTWFRQYFLGEPQGQKLVVVSLEYFLLQQSLPGTVSGHSKLLADISEGYEVGTFPGQKALIARHCHVVASLLQKSLFLRFA